MKPGLAPLLTLALVLSGCAGTEAGPSAAGGPTTAPPPTFDETTGAITGYVVNDAFEPIPGAMVGIKETGASATTDAAGAFTFGGLAPAAYTVLAQALGYDSQARPTVVDAGAAVEVQFVLTQLPTEEAYTQTIPFTGLIECAWGLSGAGSGNCLPIQSTLQQYNLGNPTNTRIIGLFNFPDPLKVESGVFEMEWNPSAAMTSGQLLLAVELEQTGIIGGKQYGRAQGNSPIKAVTSKEPWTDLKAGDQTRDQVQTRTFPATTNPPTFVVNQRFTVHASACYVEECGELFTAISDR
ncbi:MAG TPA: carboxypeptidase-like regulatory domain-containing protein [Candidatus Thermoplasmatota archaeon]|nr:carboxypeptidase-like regulatory domain-containing protein [Candidatus Thermoplasmatota archaeon]